MPQKLTHEEIVSRLPNNFKLAEVYKGLVRLNHKFICPYCNNEFVARMDSVLCGHTKSCRCLCLNLRTGNEHISGHYLYQIKINAKKRNIHFDLDIDYITDLLIGQEFKCKLSGLPIKISYDRKKITASLDRIDSNGSYIKGNVQWLHKYINKMKNSLDTTEFISLCGLVYLSNRR